MRRLLIAAPLVLALAGCNEAVQARQAPTSVDEAFGLFSRSSGVLDAEVYELPARTPDLPGAGVNRPCRPPGQLFKAIAPVAVQDTPLAYATLEPTVIAAYDPEIALGVSLPPVRAYPVAAWADPDEHGIKEPLTRPAVGILDRGPQPGVSPARVERTPMASYDPWHYSWCVDTANLRR
jgi:hypothetical protein